MSQPASAEMVLVMRSDGSLSPSLSQERFTRNYSEGVGQDSVADGLRVHGNFERANPNEELQIESVASRTPIPRPDILAAIQGIGHKYASHRGLRVAGISVTEWLNLYRANIEIESAYNPRAVSHAGAIGLGQLMPGTAQVLGVDAHDWRQNLDGSARYLALMLAEFGDVRLALAAYNAGPEAVRANSGIPPYSETQNHVQRVLAVFNRLEGNGS